MEKLFHGAFSEADEPPVNGWLSLIPPADASQGVCVCVCVCHTHTHIHTHTYIHTYIYTLIREGVEKLFHGAFSEADEPPVNG